MMFAVALAAIVLTFAKAVFIDNRPVDILFAAISALEGHFTVNAKGHSGCNFRKLRIGMTDRQVEEIIGQPLSKGQWQFPNGRDGPIPPKKAS